jgi:hypothetical protein
LNALCLIKRASGCVHVGIFRMELWHLPLVHNAIVVVVVMGHEDCCDLTYNSVTGFYYVNLQLYVLSWVEQEWNLFSFSHFTYICLLHAKSCCLQCVHKYTDYQGKHSKYLNTWMCRVWRVIFFFCKIKCLERGVWLHFFPVRVIWHSRLSMVLCSIRTP